MADNEHNEGASDNAGSKPRKRESISIFREFIIVIIGALIALAADDYQEASERADRDHQVMVMIQNELQANLDLIQQTNNYHEKILPLWQEAADVFAAEGKFTIPENWEDAKQIESFNAAYQLAVINGTLSRVPPELGMQLTKVYDELANFDLSRSQITLATIQSSFRDGTRYYNLRRVAIETEIDYVETMRALFEEAIASVNNELLH